jgi:DNA-binding NtrC family response regulator
LLGNVSLEQHARRGLARCLYWQRKYGDAASILCKDDESVEAFALKCRLALAADEIRSASMSAMRAWDLAIGSDDLRLVAVAARAMALVNVAIGNREQVFRWVAEGTRAATAAHLPIVGLRLRAIAGGTRVRSALRHRLLPTLVRAELECALSTEHQRHVSRDDDAGQERALRELHDLLTAIHGAADDNAGLDALCRLLAERTRAATVQIVGGAPLQRTLARAGRPWQGEPSDVDRILAGGAALSIVSSHDLRHAAEPISYGQDVIAVLCCRWAAGVHIDRTGAFSRMKAAALAAAASVRTLLDRSHAPQADAAIGELIGTSPPAAALRESIARAARSPFPILVEGESGSGKELVARGIHRLGARRDRRLCTLNCAALTDDLLEAELFGHSRGAFTGAIGERAGLFEEADGGTLFLDEVGELSPRAQAKLLRVLQDGEVRRVGENLPRRVDTRVIAATNRRLDEEVAAQRFRADLRFRLDVVRIVVPPLRERATDIPALALHFWSEAAARVGSSASLAPETLAALSRYDWPGNVRELQNAVAALAVHAPRRGRVAPVMLPAHIAGAITSGATSFDAARQEFERRYVRAALAQASGHRSRAARTLGVSRQGLAKMLRRLGIDG